MVLQTRAGRELLRGAEVTLAVVVVDCPITHLQELVEVTMLTHARRTVNARHDIPPMHS